MNDQNQIGEPNKKLSSVEWYRKHLHAMVSTGETLYKTENEIFEEAKAMHKQEIIDAVDGFPLENRNMLGEEYYNETYKQ